MTIARRKLLHLTASALALPAAARIAHAQSQPYPSKPVRIIVGFGPGGGSDIVARLLGQWLSERFGQPFVVENRPGASSIVGAMSVIRAPHDGYTLMIANTDRKSVV